MVIGAAFGIFLDINRDPGPGPGRAAASARRRGRGCSASTAIIPGNGAHINRNLGHTGTGALWRRTGFYTIIITGLGRTGSTGVGRAINGRVDIPRPAAANRTAVIKRTAAGFSCCRFVFKALDALISPAAGRGFIDTGIIIGHIRTGAAISLVAELFISTGDGRGSSFRSRLGGDRLWLLDPPDGQAQTQT